MPDFDALLEKAREYVLDSSSVTDEVIKMTLLELYMLTYEAQESDVFSIMFSLHRAETTICNICNITAIPEGLYHVWVDMACGRFLMQKLDTDSLGEAFDVDNAYSQIKMGDVTVSLDGDSTEDRISSLCSYLIDGGKDELLRYRKIAW